MDLVEQLDILADTLYIEASCFQGVKLMQIMTIKFQFYL